MNHNLKIAIYFSAILAVCFSFNNAWSQKVPVKNETKESFPDFRILNSNSSFIELEFVPQYHGDNDFANSVSSVLTPGEPDLKMRTFPVFFPNESSYKVEVVDSKYEDVTGAKINPVPTLKPSKDKKDGVAREYIRDEKFYGNNFFYPGPTAKAVFTGALRNKYFGYINLYPCQYNPVTAILRKFTYIRVRLIFTGSPVILNKSLSFEERMFFRNAALNFQAAETWSTREFNHVNDLPVVNSIFASGIFCRIEVKESGMYKLDKNFLQSAGMNLSSVDPRTIKIYGNDGKEVPYDNAVNYPFDPVEDAIYVSGEDDGQFNDNDYILFYGRNPNEWNYNQTLRTYFHSINHFSVSTYYWITYGGASGKRMTSQNSPSASGLTPMPGFKEKLFEEPEVNNLGSTGYLWVSQRISINQSFTFNRELKGYIAGSNVNFRFFFGNGSSFDETWRLEDLNSNFILNQWIPRLTNGFSHINLVNMNNDMTGVSYPLSPGKTSTNFKASLRSQDGNSPNVAGYYDYYEILYDRQFSADNNYLRFNTPDTSAVVEYQVSNFNSSDVKIFNVTDYRDVHLVNPISFANGVIRFQTNVQQNSPQEFIASGNSYKTPTSIARLDANQNLKGDLEQGASFIIITPKEFLGAANRLKAQREKPGQNYIRTAVVEIEKIYNEFSSGSPDPAAVRNFLKFAYNNWQERPVYVLFLGDGSYDYKNIYNLNSNGSKNWIPPISRSSPYANDVDSYCSDDFIMEINESHPEPESCISDFAGGRLPAVSSDEANTVVDKIISYEDPANFDQWRMEALYVADDGWTTENTNGEEGSLHTDQCEDVAQNYSPSYLKKDKVYIVSYPAEITPQGRRKPGANADIIKEWNKGKLIINYTGHGSIDLWAHEHIFERQVTVPLLTNKNKYSFVTIASCDLARWDDPYNLSAGEQLVTIKDKGAIGVVAAVRPVYSVPNATFNNKLYSNLFKIDTLDYTLRTGKAMFNVKQELYFDNDLKFALLCDPTLRLGVPEVRTRIDSINSTPGGQLFEMKSLQKVRIYGSVLKNDSSFWGDYNGTVELEVFDVDKNISLIDFGYTFNYKLFGGKIFTGKRSVVNGKWSIDFVVPRDISYNPGRGRIMAYLNNGSTDGIGFSNNFIMNGIDSLAAVDSTGPSINVYLDSRNFRTGDLVNQNPKLIADISDDNGINLTGTIGHKIEAILNDDENNKIDLTPFFTSSSSYQNGSVEYQLNDLADGNYKLEIKAWDTYNNFNTSIVDFEVKSSSQLALDNVYNYPNPMQDFTNFVFEHNFSEPLDADIKIYTVSGRLIKELNKSNITDKFVSIPWDGKDTDGDIIANGTYLYKIIIKSEAGGYSKSTIGKLAKLK